MRFHGVFNISLRTLVRVMSDDLLVRGWYCGKTSLTIAALIGSLIFAATIAAPIELTILVLKVISSPCVMILRLLRAQIKIVIESTHPVWIVVRLRLHIVNPRPIQQSLLQVVVIVACLGLDGDRHQAY